MAKKSKARVRTVRPQQPPAQRAVVQRRWPLKLIMGGVILALALGIGAVVRFQQQRDLAPRLQGTVDRHYTRGVVGAPVVIKEFSDYT
jgi:uncharacterized protein HemX